MCLRLSDAAAAEPVAVKCQARVSQHLRATAHCASHCAAHCVLCVPASLKKPSHLFLEHGGREDDVGHELDAAQRRQQRLCSKACEEHKGRMIGRGNWWIARQLFLPCQTIPAQKTCLHATDTQRCGSNHPSAALTLRVSTLLL